ncbi:hypothetical protein [Actinomyces sp. ZJ308]|uniref:hypothetical protein n=1 Tax=Actinomyces sp. ZJ308 TaxID=2708342 RepID=UPI0014216B4A|nr:hypothetical protein [Actinomyces sp. ZJ308]
MAVSLLLSGCSAVNSISGARASASSTAAVAGNIPVCDVTSSDEVEKATGQQIRTFSYEHDSELEPFYVCRVSGFLEQQIKIERVEVKFKSSTEVDVPTLYDAHTYSEVAARQDASPFTLDGVSGEGVTISLDANNWAAVWQYSDGSILTVFIVCNERAGELSDGNKTAASIAGLFVEKVPQVASGPNQQLIFYPEDSYQLPRSEGATPLTPWPSPSR